MAAWYVQFKDALIGPASEKEILKGIKASKIPSNAYVCREGEVQWYAILNLDFFAQHFTGEQLDMEVELIPERQWVILATTNNSDFEQDGPYATREVLEMIAMGDLDYSDRIWRPGQDTWLRIGELENFVPSSLNDGEKLPREVAHAPEGLLSAQSSEDLLSSVSSFEGRDILEHALNARPKEAVGEDLTQNVKKQMPELSVDEINQMSFRLENKQASSATAGEEVIKSWIPKPKLIKDSVKSFKLNFSQIFAVGFLLLLVGFLMKQFIVIEPTTKLEANEKSVTEFKKPSLRIYGVALASMRPRLEMRSNYDREDQLELQIIGREGRILNHFRFSKSIEKAFVPGESIEVNLSDFQLSDGLYIVRANLGNLRAEKEIFVGVNDIQFESRLKQFNSQKKKRAELEKKILESVGDELKDRVSELIKTLEQDKLSKLEWKSFYNSWKRKFYDSAHTELRSFSPDTADKFVNVEDFTSLKQVRLDLWKASKDIRAENSKKSVQTLKSLDQKIRSL